MKTEERIRKELKRLQDSDGEGEDIKAAITVLQWVLDDGDDMEDIPFDNIWQIYRHVNPAIKKKAQLFWQKMSRKKKHLARANVTRFLAHKPFTGYNHPLVEGKRPRRNGICHTVLYH